MATAATIFQLTDPQHWRSAYDDVLALCFPPAELDPYDELHQALAAGELVAFGTQVSAGDLNSGSPHDSDSNPDGPTNATRSDTATSATDSTNNDNVRIDSVVMLSTHQDVALVLYLAIAPNGRGAGRGSALLTYAVSYAQNVLGASYVLAEVEHPNYHEPSQEYGDPVARLRFYQRHGLRILDAPYFQPGLGPGTPRVPALLLGVLWTSSSVQIGPSAVTGAPILRFITRYVAASEGSLADDGAMRRLLDSLRGDTIKAWDIADLDQVPVGTLGADESHAPR